MKIEIEVNTTNKQSKKFDVGVGWGRKTTKSSIPVFVMKQFAQSLKNLKDRINIDV